MHEDGGSAESGIWAALAKEFVEMGALIAALPPLLSGAQRKIHGAQSLGTGLLAQSVELARGFRRCMEAELPGASVALCRAQYESALRGHVILHEVPLDEMRALRAALVGWKSSEGQPPEIRVAARGWVITSRRDGDKWPSNPKETDWTPLGSEQAKHWQEDILNTLPLLHDFAHSGLVQGTLSVDQRGVVMPRHPPQLLARCLFLVERTLIFAAATWPGVIEKSRDDVHRLARELYVREERWDGDYGFPGIEIVQDD